MRPVRKNKQAWNLAYTYPLYLMVLPAIVLLFIFSYVPMYGLIISFQDYYPTKGFFNSPFVGLKWFRVAIENPDFFSIIFNTVFIAVGKLILGTIFTIGFALLLNEVSSERYRKGIQTLVYFPNFLSWVIIGGIFLEVLSVDGIVNQLLNFFGIKSVFFLGENKVFPWVLIVTDVWKNFGWGSIIYLAALSNINPELYEAAVIDGAGKLKQAWHITLPSIRPTIVLLLTLSLGSILNAGFEQVLVLYNPLVYSSGDIIDTYVYRTGLLGGNFSLSSAIGFAKSLIGLGLIAISYRLAYKYTGYRIF